MAALLPIVAEHAPLETCEPGLESEPDAAATLRPRGLQWWKNVARTKRTAVASAGIAVLLLVAVASFSRSHFRGAREADMQESVELTMTTSQIAAKVMAARPVWAMQFERSQATTFNHLTHGPAVVQKVGLDYLHVYVDHGNVCSLTFSGSNTLFEDCIGTQEMVDVPQCGMTKIYKCYLREMVEFLTNDQWSTTSDFLTSDKCSGGVHAVGWSLGGTIAGLFSTCANNAKNGSVVFNGKTVKLPIIKSMLTFGAPDVGEGAQPLNGQSQDGIFKGIRMWNEEPTLFSKSNLNVDGCSWEWEGVGKLMGVHPKMWAMSVRTLSPMQGGPTAATLYRPTTEVAKRGKTNYHRKGPCPGPLHFPYKKNIQNIGSVKVAS